MTATARGDDVAALRQRGRGRAVCSRDDSSDIAWRV